MDDRSVLSRDARPADAEIYFGDPKRDLIALIHGGFWRPEYDLTHLRPMASALSDAGWPVVLIEYTRIPGRPDLMIADIKRAVDNLPANTILMGHSAGGHLALWAAGYLTAKNAASATATSASGPIAPKVEVDAVRVIALAPVADLELARELDLDEGAVRDFLGDHDSRDYQPSVSGAVLIHGTDDVIVPISLSESYARLHEGCRLIRVPGEGHFALIDPESSAWPVVIDELNLLLA